MGEGRTVIVTGARGGIGEATANKFCHLETEFTGRICRLMNHHPTSTSKWCVM